MFTIIIQIRYAIIDILPGSIWGIISITINFDVHHGLVLIGETATLSLDMNGWTETRGETNMHPLRLFPIISSFIICFGTILPTSCHPGMFAGDFREKTQSCGVSWYFSQTLVEMLRRSTWNQHLVRIRDHHILWKGSGKMKVLGFHHPVLFANHWYSTGMMVCMYIM